MLVFGSGFAIGTEKYKVCLEVYGDSEQKPMSLDSKTE